MPRIANEEKLLAALLKCSTIVDAARACRISVETAHRHLRDPEFKARYREARRQMVEQAIACGQSLTGEALDTLKRNMTSGNPGSEVRSAQLILDWSARGVEVADILERLEALENANATTN